MNRACMRSIRFPRHGKAVTKRVVENSRSSARTPDTEGLKIARKLTTTACKYTFKFKYLHVNFLRKFRDALRGPGAEEHNITKLCIPSLQRDLGGWPATELVIFSLPEGVHASQRQQQGGGAGLGVCGSPSEGHCS